MHGAHNAQLHELYPEDHSAFKKIVRMDKQCFVELLDFVTSYIRRKNTVMRDAIPQAERLSITKDSSQQVTNQQLLFMYLCRQK